MFVLFIYITRLASNEIFSPSNKIHREVGRAKDLGQKIVSRNGINSPSQDTGYTSAICIFNRNTSVTGRNIQGYA
jgi:hypothetical protein